MLNLWKKIQEKGFPNSPRKGNAKFSSLDPRYDGPLKYFPVNLTDDIVPLEKCRLLLEFDDIFVNQTAYIYFKYFLDSKMVSEILPAWDEIANGEIRNCDENVGARQQCVKPNDNIRQVDVLSSKMISVTTSNGFHFKLSEQAREKLTLVAIKKEENWNVDNAIANTSTPSLENVLLECWNEFVRSEWYCRYQIDLLTSRSITLGDILLHETALSYFMQFLEIEGCHHVLEFWLAASNFQKLVRSSSERMNADLNDATNDAICIYEKYVSQKDLSIQVCFLARQVYEDKYLSLLATYPLGFNDSIRCAVEEAICDEIHGPHADSFQVAANIALSFLRKQYLIPFLSSQHYVHLLSDMIRHCATVMNHTLSSSSSSLCSTVTVPAVINECQSSVEFRGGGADDDDGECVSVSLTKPFSTKVDPESTWHRRKQSGLSFGHVDQLGRYRRDIEPDPGRSDKSKISKMMKKLIQKNVARIEEEMAWQVAEMVVKDITDLTMGNNTDHSVKRNDRRLYNKYFS